MKYQEFLCAVEQEFHNKHANEVEIQLYHVSKNNGMGRKGILIQSKESNLSPVIYLEEFYDQVLNGKSVETVVEEIWNIYQKVEAKEQWDATQFQNYEKMKKNLVFKVVNAKKNRALLDHIPHVKILDFVLVFYALLNLKETGQGSIQIQNEHLKIWNVNRDELYEQAIKNAKHLLPAQFFSMQQALAELMGEDEKTEQNILKKEADWIEDTMYVLTNKSRNYGAACMFYPFVLDMIGDLLREDFYVLPSSVHEVIIVPKSKGMPQNEMSQIVKEINETQVEPEEVLSDHIYQYERESKELTMGNS